jgi:hypothetical protein
MTRRLFSSFLQGMRSRRIPRGISTISIVGLALALAAPVVQAATFTCAAGDVQCLIIAINQANANLQPENTIQLEAGTYTLMNVDNNTDGANGLPSITSNLTISGAGAIATEITRTPPGLFFRLIHVSATGKLTLQGLTLSGGISLDPGTVIFNNGGMITLVRSLITRSFGIVFYNNGGKVKLLQSTMADNLSGLWLFVNTASGIVSIMQSTFAGNRSDEGVIYTGGRVEITESQFVHNLGFHEASAIFVAGGTVDVTKTTFAHNHADGSTIFLGAGSLVIISTAFLENVSGQGLGSGGAGFAAGITISQQFGGTGEARTLNVTNTTFARNAGGGGFPLRAVAIDNEDGTAIVTNSTLADNFAVPTEIAAPVIFSSPGVTTILQNTIVANNGPRVRDCGGTITSGGNNVIGNPVGCAINLQPSDITGDPGLGPFTDNGTPGKGHFPLLSTSRAINAANTSVCPTKDQIGQPRIPHCDIGAVEFSHNELVQNLP